MLIINISVIIVCNQQIDQKVFFYFWDIYLQVIVWIVKLITEYTDSGYLPLPLPHNIVKKKEVGIT